MDFTTVIRAVAPWIGTALGGPLGGLAVTAAANALGLSDKTAEALQGAISGATPEQLQALKKADQDFAMQMKALDFKNVSDLEAIAAGDRDSARKMQIANKSFMPAVITAGLLSAFAATLFVMFFLPIPTNNRDQIIFMVGQLSGFSASAVAFWLGSTRQSEDKTNLLAQSAPSK